MKKQEPKTKLPKKLTGSTWVHKRTKRLALVTYTTYSNTGFNHAVVEPVPTRVEYRYQTAIDRTQGTSYRRVITPFVSTRQVTIENFLRAFRPAVKGDR